MKIAWPQGRRFAFTAVDDTDWSILGTVKPVYDLLADLGMRTTKSVWMFQDCDGAGYQGQTCEDSDYLEWVLCLRQRGFEISMHNAAPVTSSRERTRCALDRFRDTFGADRLMHCNHRDCAENIYWGEHRFSGLRRSVYKRLTEHRPRQRFRGHIEGDPLFWGDLCRERVAYVRNFVFGEINTLKVCPEMPYHDPAKPYVNAWFTASDGGSLKRFLRTYTYENVDRLAAEGGLSIAYVHFGCNFVRDGAPDPEFRKRLEYIASRGGAWFAPTSTILDFLAARQTPEQHVISPARLRRLEFDWLLDKVRLRLHSPA